MGRAIEREDVEGSDGGALQTPERSFALELSVRDLAAGNQQIGIFNTVAYGQMDTHFREDLFQEILVANVRDLNKPDEEAHQWGVVDGHTRLKFAYDTNRDSVRCLDATQVVLAKLGIEAERDYLLPEEYLRATVEYTLIHPEYSAERAAAHFMNTWHSIVGDVSNVFSTTLAMQYLERYRHDGKLSGRRLGQFLRELPITFESDEAFVQTLQTCQHGLQTMDSVMSKLNLSRGALYDSAIGLFVTGDGIAGGEPAITQEVLSIVHLIGNEVPPETSMQVREQISAAAIAALRGLAPTFGVKRAVHEVIWTVETKTMPWDEKLAALQSGKPLEYHKQHLGRPKPNVAQQQPGEITPRRTEKKVDSGEIEATEAYATLLLGRLSRNIDGDYTDEGLATFRRLYVTLGQVISKK